MYTIQHKDRRNHNRWTATVLPFAARADAQREHVAQAILYPNEAFRVIDADGRQVGPIIGGRRAA